MSLADKPAFMALLKSSVLSLSNGDLYIDIICLRLNAWGVCTLKMLSLGI